jgi:hypothetical protein
MSQTYVPAALRRLVRERAGDRCEYCLIPESASFAPHWIDHVVAEKHGGKTYKVFPCELPAYSRYSQSSC